MKVLILTSKPHWAFVNGVANQYREHEFWISEATTFPNEYDVGISFMHLHKVPAEQVNTHTWINFHPAPLPEYKGRNLCYHAIMNGETEFGVSVHYMDENFDTGDIITVFRFYITPQDTSETLSKFALKTSEQLFKSYLPRILAGEEFEHHPNVGGTYYSKESIDDFIDINYETVETFERKVRAIYYPPHYPKIEIGEVKYKIVRDE